MTRVRFAIVLLCVCVISGMLAGCRNGDSNGDEDGQATATVDADASEPTATQALVAPTENPPSATSTSDASAVPATPQPAASPTSPAPTVAPTEGEELTLNVYFLRDERLAVAHRTVPRTQAVGMAALEQLLIGPTTRESELGYASAVPDGTEILGLEIEDGIAWVDLNAVFESGGGSLSMAARLAQIAFTLTQVPAVDAVQFLLEGELVEVFGGEGLVLDEPVGRDFEDLLPAIFLESPAAFDTVGSPLRIAGTANVFEATFMVRVVSVDGAILAEQVVTATSGSGTRGTFEATVSFEVEEDVDGMVVVFESSARDGEPINVIEVPVRLQS